MDAVVFIIFFYPQSNVFLFFAIEIIPIGLEKKHKKVLCSQL